MRTLSILLLSALAFNATHFSLAIADDSAGGKLPTSEICGSIVWSTDNQAVSISANNGTSYSLDEKSGDRVEEYLAAHPEGRATVPRPDRHGLRPLARTIPQPRWCLEGELVDRTIHSAEVISVSAQ